MIESIFCIEEEDGIVAFFPELPEELFETGNDLDIFFEKIEDKVYLRIGDLMVIFLPEVLLDFLENNPRVYIGVLPVREVDGNIKYSYVGKKFEYFYVEISPEDLARVRSAETEFLDEKLSKLVEELVAKGLSQEEAYELAMKFKET